jgi:hypothetical protein
VEVVPQSLRRLLEIVRQLLFASSVQAQLEPSLSESWVKSENKWSLPLFQVGSPNHKVLLALPLAEPLDVHVAFEVGEERFQSWPDQRSVNQGEDLSFGHGFQSSLQGFTNKVVRVLPENFPNSLEFLSRVNRVPCAHFFGLILLSIQIKDFHRVRARNHS